MTRTVAGTTHWFAFGARPAWLPRALDAKLPFAWTFHTSTITWLIRRRWPMNAACVMPCADNR